MAAGAFGSCIDLHATWALDEDVFGNPQVTFTSNVEGQEPVSICLNSVKGALVNGEVQTIANGLLILNELFGSGVVSSDGSTYTVTFPNQDPQEICLNPVKEVTQGDDGITTIIYADESSEQIEPSSAVDNGDGTTTTYHPDGSEHTSCNDPVKDVLDPLGVSLVTDGVAQIADYLQITESADGSTGTVTNTLTGDSCTFLKTVDIPADVSVVDYGMTETTNAGGSTSYQFVITMSDGTVFPAGPVIDMDKFGSVTDNGDGTGSVTDPVTGLPCTFIKSDGLTSIDGSVVINGTDLSVVHPDPDPVTAESTDGSVDITATATGYDFSVTHPDPKTVESADASVVVTPTSTGFDLSVETTPQVVLPDGSELDADADGRPIVTQCCTWTSVVDADGNITTLTGEVVPAVDANGDAIPPDCNAIHFTDENGTYTNSLKLQGPDGYSLTKITADGDTDPAGNVIVYVDQYGNAIPNGISAQHNFDEEGNYIGSFCSGMLDKVEKLEQGDAALSKSRSIGTKYTYKDGTEKIVEEAVRPLCQLVNSGSGATLVIDNTTPDGTAFLIGAVDVSIDCPLSQIGISGYYQIAADGGSFTLTPATSYGGSIGVSSNGGASITPITVNDTALLWSVNTDNAYSGVQCLQRSADQTLEFYYIAKTPSNIPDGFAVVVNQIGFSVTSAELCCITNETV